MTSITQICFNKLSCIVAMFLQLTPIGVSSRAVGCSVCLLVNEGPRFETVSRTVIAVVFFPRDIIYQHKSVNLLE
ncbi:hypothetical protein JOB18_043543 [Solea senegalensis]|uniref:Secreted protein n=1 Tax=Solea senegalensis TaxID=28829 RepID=A0AAV6RED3_SOLSE|nr:hypothetical protein JOB18_043543 [Solea senegalensis]